jgi:hypothetical protein
MYDNRAAKKFHGAPKRMAIERRTHSEQRRNSGPSRELRVAAEQKRFRHPTPIWERVQSGHDPEGQKGAACSEAPIFGRELDSISTRRKVKPGLSEGVQLAESAAPLLFGPAGGLAPSQPDNRKLIYRRSSRRNDCHPCASGVTSIHANLLPVLRLLLLLYVLRRRVFWHREARQLRYAI